MSIPNPATGVCAACKYDPDCIYEALSRGVILQCEQFEMELPRPAVPTASLQARDAMDTNGYKGLCSNCENRKTCIYPKPEGGVWRCEEYA